MTRRSSCGIPSKRWCIRCWKRFCWSSSSSSCFLQTWRASIIPLAAVPVSLVGTFAVMLALGFSINTLSLFGLVLAIGIVVDDAIVVVENVERNIALGLSPVDAAKRAMSEVTGPIIATALVLVRGVRADGVHQRTDRPVLQAVRDHHRHLDGHFRVQFADAFAGAVRGAARKAITRRKTGFRALMEKVARLVLPSVQPRVRLGGQQIFRRRRRGAAQERHRADGLWRTGVPDRLELQQSPDRLRADAGQAISGRLRAIAGRRLARPHRKPSSAACRTSA